MASPRTLSLGALLRRYRMAAGLTQEELAEKAGLSVNAIGALERGISRAPRRDTVALLADALGLREAERAIFERAIFERAIFERAIFERAARQRETQAPTPAARDEEPGSVAEGQPFVGRAFRQSAVRRRRWCGGRGPAIRHSGHQFCRETTVGHL